MITNHSFLFHLWNQLKKTRDQSSTSVAGCYQASCFLLLPLNTDLGCPWEGRLGLQSRSTPLARQKEHCSSHLSGHGSQDRRIRAGMTQGRGPPRLWQCGSFSLLTQSQRGVSGWEVGWKFSSSTFYFDFCVCNFLICMYFKSFLLKHNIENTRHESMA